MENKLSLCFLAASIVFNSAALLFLKVVAVTLDISSGIDFMQMMFLLKNWMLWVGGFMFLAGLFFWALSLKKIPLSIAYPTSAISYIFIALLSRRLFAEVITFQRIIGMLVILTGVLLLYSKRKDSA